MGNNRNAVTPLYVQIADTLAARIFSGELQHGESIGSQRELEQEFAVSLVTIRQALSLLKERDLIVSRQGKGFFVKDQAMVGVPLPGLANLSAVMVAQGRTATVHVPQFEVTPAPITIAEALGLEAGKPALHVQRVHLLDSHAVALADIWGMAEFAAHLSPSDFTQTEVSTTIGPKLRVEFGEAEQIVRAVAAPRQVVEVLEVEPCSPLFMARKLFKSTNGQPLFLVILYYRSDTFEFRLRLNLDQLTGNWLPR